MTPEDRISVLKFTKLVENCESKEQILDLCEKALKKYRPDSMQGPHDTPFQFSQKIPLTRNTYKVRAKQTVDMATMNSAKVLPMQYENALKGDIVNKLATELFRNGFVKFESYDDMSVFQKNYVGTLEVVVP